MNQPKTIIDLVRKFPAAAILMVHRHASYLMGPIRGRYASDAHAYAANYSEVEPPCLFLLDDAGIQRSREQGMKLAEAGVKIEEIVASHQGRGPDTALRISEGVRSVTGEWVPVSCDKHVDYPRYHFEAARACLADPAIGDKFVAEWLNGKRPDLVRSDTPESFRDRTIAVVDELLAKPGLRMMSCHFEQVTLVHNIFVVHRDLGTINEKWFPTKSGGVVIVRHPDSRIEAYDYTPELDLVNDFTSALD